MDHLDDAWDRLLEMVTGRRIIVLAGAGCSTESGIPDYRGNGTPRRRAPVQYQAFVRDPSARKRYWARSTIGWPRIRAARPNPGHQALARMEQAGHVAGLITQNVDGLHQAAGSRRVVELHGSLAMVRCIECGVTVTRDAFQERLLALNVEWAPRVPGVAVQAAPDGDAELDADAVEVFRVPDCVACAGVVKPHVVFFGENVPAEVVRVAWNVFEDGDILLVTGSSLAVYSGRRFVDRACRKGIPVVIINRGPTRADAVAAVKVDGRLGTHLPALADALG
jgi:NAD+-dependent protein deacetylase sirtuin 4